MFTLFALSAYVVFFFVALAFMIGAHSSEVDNEGIEVDPELEVRKDEMNVTVQKVCPHAWEPAYNNLGMFHRFVCKWCGEKGKTLWEINRGDG